MTVSTHLSTTASCLILNDSEKASITNSLSTLGSRLDTYFGSRLTSHFKFGSYPRVTILPRKADPLSDVDYMVIFDTSEGNKKPQTYLDRLRRFAETKYSTSEISQSHPTIVLSLNHIRFELVPAIYDWGYKIPSPSSSWEEWMSTDPTAADTEIAEMNKNHDYCIKPLVRLIKYWNAKQGYPFRSYDLEKQVLNMSFFSCTYLREYFYYFWTHFNASLFAPQTTVDKVNRAKGYASEAKKLESDGYPALAEKEIKKIIPEL